MSTESWWPIRRFVLVFFAAGAVVPIIWLVALKMLGEESVASTMQLHPWLNAVLIALWPSSIGLIILSETFDTLTYLLLLLVNCLVYASIGALIWLSLRKSKAILVLLAVVISVIWYALLRMYFG